MLCIITVIEILDYGCSGRYVFYYSLGQRRDEVGLWNGFRVNQSDLMFV